MSKDIVQVGPLQRGRIRTCRTRWAYGRRWTGRTRGTCGTGWATGLAGPIGAAGPAGSVGPTGVAGPAGPAGPLGQPAQPDQRARRVTPARHRQFGLSPVRMAFAAETTKSWLVLFARAARPTERSARLPAPQQPGYVYVGDLLLHSPRGGIRGDPWAMDHHRGLARDPLNNLGPMSLDRHAGRRA